MSLILASAFTINFVYAGVNEGKNEAIFWVQHVKDVLASKVLDFRTFFCERNPRLGGLLKSLLKFSEPESKQTPEKVIWSLSLYKHVILNFFAS